MVLIKKKSNVFSSKGSFLGVQEGKNLRDVFHERPLKEKFDLFNDFFME